MNQTTFSVDVTTRVIVKIDKSMMTSEFFKHFEHTCFPLEGVEDHAKHLANLQAREAVGADGYVDGYGLIQERGISISTDTVSCNIVEIE